MPKSNPQPVPTDEFMLPLSTFLRHLTNTPDEVWAKLLKTRHGSQTKVFSAWKAALDALKKS